MMWKNLFGLHHHYLKRLFSETSYVTDYFMAKNAFLLNAYI